MKTTLKCAKCGDDMEPIESSAWNDSIERQCLYNKSRCEFCCNCGGHN